MDRTKLFWICLCFLMAGCGYLRKNATVYSCKGLDGKSDTLCDFGTRIDEENWRGMQEAIDGFRDCKKIFVQGEDESQSQFAHRIAPIPDSSCVVFKKAVQPGPLNWPAFGIPAHAYFIGGTFEVPITKE